MKRNILFNGRRSKKNLFHTNRIRGRWNVPAALAAGVVFCLLLFCLLSALPHLDKEEEAVIVLTARSITISQGDNLPEFTASASFAEGTDSKTEKTWLSREAGYNVQDLLDDLNQGGDYEMECDTDGTQAGTYPIRIRLSGELKSSLESEWKGKVRIETRTGTLTVAEPEQKK
nr:hypothetical protein [uncultured Sellimonas sp.]